MKTIVSLALAGLMSISALLPALAAQEAESVSIPESSGISESMAQDESSIQFPQFGDDAASVPAVQRMKALRRSPAAMRGADVSQPESDSMPVESDSSTSGWFGS